MNIKGLESYIYISLPITTSLKIKAKETKKRKPVSGSISSGIILGGCLVNATLLSNWMPKALS